MYARTVIGVGSHLVSHSVSSLGAVCSIPVSLFLLSAYLLISMQSFGGSLSVT